MTKIIVTGGLGFIGKNFCHQINSMYDQKFIIDKVSYASDLDYFYSHLKPLGWELLVFDLSDLSNFPQHDLFKSSTVVNFAAESHVDASFSNAIEFLKSNALGSLNIIEACLNAKCRLLHISTDEVYGEVTDYDATEDSIIKPTNPYSATKAAADIIVQTYITCFHLNAKIVRANNIYGPRQLNEKIIPKAIYSAHNNKNLYIHGSKDLTRHFLHTCDFTEALNKILETWYESQHKVFNVAGDENVSIRELAKYIYQTCGVNDHLVKDGEDRPFNDAAYRIDDRRIRSLGWSPKIDFWNEIDALCHQKNYISRRVSY